MKTLAGKPFALIGVHLKYDDDDNASKLKRVMVKEGLNWRSFADKGPIAEVWKPPGTPTFYIIDPKGVIRHKWAGAPGDKAIDAALEPLIRQAELDAKKTPN